MRIYLSYHIPFYFSFGGYNPEKIGRVLIIEGIDHGKDRY